MRNTKVKLMKRVLALSLAIFCLGSNISFAVTQWSDVQSQVDGASGNSVTVEIDSDMETGGTALNLGAPPVPNVIINGNGNTITATAPGGGGDKGYIVNNGSNLTVNQTNFKDGQVGVPAGDSDTSFGGAIHNESSLILNGSNDDGTNSTFENNTIAGSGGAISNGVAGGSESSVQINNYDFIGNTATSDGYTTGATNAGMGGAIYSNSTVDISLPSLIVRYSNFENNTASNYGGAIANLRGSAQVAHSDFTGNKVTSGEGGAIYNWADMDISNSTFTGNSASTSGGAVANGSSSNYGQDAIMEISNTSFTNNFAATSGAAVLNRASDAGHKTVLTIKNGSSFVNNGFTGSTGAYQYSQSGGAIANLSKADAAGTDPELIIQGTSSNKILFKGNTASTGGAIDNEAKATISYATFDSNGSHADQVAINGGAISNANGIHSTSDLTISNSEFINNKAQNGGAIYNKDGSATIINTDFTGNTATNSSIGGGAIYSGAGSTTTLIAQDATMNVGDVSNSANNIDSISLQGTAGNEVTLNLEANNGTLNINSNVIGSIDPGTSASVANININGNGVGRVNVNGDAKVTSSNINLNEGGTLHFAKDTGLDSTNALTFNGGTLNMLNGVVSNLDVKNISVLANSNLFLDVDLANEKMDNILDANNTVDPVSDGVNLNIAGMKSISEAADGSATILFTDVENLIGHITSNGSRVIESPRYKYSVEQITVPTTGGSGQSAGWDPGEYFHFEKLGDSDSVIVAPVAAQAAFLIMDNLYRQSFANMDMVTLMTPEQRMAWKMRNKYANNGYHTGVYAPNIIPEERDGWYMRPFTNFENVPLKNGPKVSNVSYGTLIGGESDLIDLGHGWDGNFSVFAAYHGSHQAYNGNSIWQNGGTLGAVGTAYKGNFWTGFTANIGASAAEATTMWGHDNFPILMTGAAWKSGYNWGLFNNKVVIQPSYMMSYTFVNVFDYTNAAGVRITQDPLHAIEIIPGLRIIGNLKNGWQPYIGLNMTWNIMDKTKFYADDVALTPLSVKPYFEYGVGLQKRYGDRFTGFGQAMLRNGGRNGIAFTLGFRWALGN